jgi:hypothetical protein
MRCPPSACNPLMPRRPALSLDGNAAQGKAGNAPALVSPSTREHTLRKQRSLDQRLPGGRHGAIRIHSRLGSVAYVAVTFDKNGDNLPSNIDGNKVEWSRIQTSHGEVFSLLSNSDMERDLHEAQIHITETRTTRAGARTALLAVQNARLTTTARCPEQSGDIARYGPALCRSQGGISGRATSCASSA